MLLVTMCSISLLAMQGSETGRQFAGVYLWPFLYIGATLAVPQSSGTSPELSKISARAGATVGAISRSTRGLI